MRASRLLEDSRLRPDLFHWNGQMDAAGLHIWLTESPWVGRCPADLLELWRETGGGDVFETETILGPLGDPRLDDDILAVNSALRGNGMPDRFLVFHRGMLVSAANTELGDYVELSPSGFDVLRRFPSLDAWYSATLRDEYADRYHLPK
jgi:hypothetical protein